MRMNEAVPEPPAPVVVLYTELSPAALRGVIESFVLREGTEYGANDVALEVKVAQVRRQLERGEARIMFDPGTETIDIAMVRGNGAAP